MAVLRACSARCPAHDPHLLRVSIAALICGLNGDSFFQNQAEELAAMFLHRCFLSALGAEGVVPAGRATCQDEKSRSLCARSTPNPRLSVCLCSSCFPILPSEISQPFVGTPLWAESLALCPCPTRRQERGVPTPLGLSGACCAVLPFCSSASPPAAISSACAAM